MRLNGVSVGCKAHHPLILLVLSDQPMNLKSVLLLPGTIALGIACVSISPAMADSITVPVPENDPPTVPIDLKLNDQQQAAIDEIADFALDQIEAIVTSGLDPQKIDREQIDRRANKLREVLPALRPDEQQLGQLRTLIRNARQTLERQIKTAPQTKFNSAEPPSDPLR